VPKPLHPVDAAWLRLCAEQAAAYDCLLSLVTAVREAGSPLARPVQRSLRGEAAAAMVALGLERYERQGVRFTLVPAPVIAVRGEYVVIARSYVRVSLDPAARRTLRLRQAMKVQGGATIVDLLARRAARERVA
jgi:uncharacterized protein YunC (DUF1805 family)